MLDMSIIHFHDNIRGNSYINDGNQYTKNRFINIEYGNKKYHIIGKSVVM